MEIISREEQYNQLSSLAVIIMLKVFYDVGINVKNAVKNYKIHPMTTYGYYDELVTDLSLKLYPHLFDGAQDINYCSLDFQDGEVNENTMKTDMLLESLDIPSELKKKIESSRVLELTEYLCCHIFKGNIGAFEFIDWDKLVESANPYLYDERFIKLRNNSLSHNYNGFGRACVTSTKHCITEDNGIDSYYFVSKDKSTFTLFFNIEDLWGNPNLTSTTLLLGELRRQYNESIK